MSDPNRPEGWASLGAAWRSDDGGVSFEAVDVDAVRARGATFARRIRRRNAIEVFGCAFVIASGVQIVWTETRPLMVAGGVAIALGATVVAAMLLVRARNAAPPPLDAPTRDILAHERRELDRQARLLERVWVWYLAPLLPGVILICSDELLLAIERGSPYAIVEAAGFFLAALLAFVFVGWLNARSARRLRLRARGIVSEDDVDAP